MSSESVDSNKKTEFPATEDEVEKESESKGTESQLTESRGSVDEKKNNQLSGSDLRAEIGAGGSKLTESRGPVDDKKNNQLSGNDLRAEIGAGGKEKSDEEIKSGRLACMQEATSDIARTAAERFGAEKVDAMKIGKDDIGTALSAMVLGPDVCQLMGREQTQSFGKKLLVFGIAPMFGAADEAKSEFSKDKVKETVHEGSANVLMGTGVGVILKRCHPAVLLGAMGLSGKAFVDDQMNSPEHQARNAELRTIASKVDGADNADLLNYCDRTKDLLGPDIFKGAYATATGGVGLPEGKALSPLVKEEASQAMIRLDKADIVAGLSALPTEAWQAVAGALGQKQFTTEAGPLGENVFKMEIHKTEFPEPVGSQHDGKINPQGAKDHDLPASGGEIQSGAVKGGETPHSAGDPIEASQEFENLQENEHKFSNEKSVVYSDKEVDALPGPNRGLVFIAETPRGMVQAKDFQSGAEGAMSHAETGKFIVPSLRYDNPNPHGDNHVRFDSMRHEKSPDGETVLVDSKVKLGDWTESMRDDTKASIGRQVEAIRQNPGFKLEHEFPNERTAEQAQKRYDEWGFGDTISVRVRK